MMCSGDMWASWVMGWCARNGEKWEGWNTLRKEEGAGAGASARTPSTCRRVLHTRSKSKMLV